MKLYQLVAEALLGDGRQISCASTMVWVNRENAEDSFDAFTRSIASRDWGVPIMAFTNSYIQELSIGEEVAEAEGNLE